MEDAECLNSMEPKSMCEKSLELCKLSVNGTFMALECWPFPSSLGHFHSEVAFYSIINHLHFHRYPRVPGPILCFRPQESGNLRNVPETCFFKCHQRSLGRRGKGGISMNQVTMSQNQVRPSPLSLQSCDPFHTRETGRVKEERVRAGKKLSQKSA